MTACCHTAKPRISFSLPLTWIIWTASCSFSQVSRTARGEFSSLLLLDMALYLLCLLSGVTAFKRYSKQKEKRKVSKKKKKTYSGLCIQTADCTEFGGMTPFPGTLIWFGGCDQISSAGIWLKERGIHSWCNQAVTTLNVRGILFHRKLYMRSL